jgi:hypothetical protein
MNKVLEFLSGKKTYIVVLVTAVIIGLLAAGIQIPEYVWPLLGACGLGTIRSAVAGVVPVQGSGFFTGKKTYIIAAIMAVLGGLQAYGLVIPEFVFGLLATAGAGTIRMAIPKML